MPEIVRRLVMSDLERKLMDSIGESSPLYCLICGYERSGTTVVAELLRQYPHIDGRFECGFLLSAVPLEFLGLEPYASNLKIAWGFDENSLNYICQAESWPQVYQRLLAESNIPSKNSFIYDKTPRYMRYLRDVLRKTVVPCIVVVKDPRAVYWSQYKREPFEVNQFCHYFLNYANEYNEALKLYSERILLVQYEELCINPLHEAKRIYDFLGFEFSDEYILLQREGDPYVAQGGINSAAILEYKDNVSKEDQEFILEQTKQFSCWHWNGQK